MVFDATVSGLNNSLWYPNFVLPSMGSLLMILGPEMHMVDTDVGKFFYNCRLSSLLANHYRVDLVSYLGNNKDRRGTTLWMLWVRLMVGLVLSPYATI